METAGRVGLAELMVETYGQQSVEVTREVLEKINRRDLVQRFSEISLGSGGPSGSLELEGCGSMTQVSSDWTKLDPEVKSTDETPTYSLQSEAGNFECSVSGLRWVCKEKVSLKYQFCSSKYHMEKIESIQYMPAGPLMDIKVIAGKLDVVFLPHWICIDDNPTILDKFAVLHIDDCGVTVEKVSEVTSSHVKLCEPTFSLKMVLVKLGFSVEINCRVFVHKTNRPFLKLHVYLIPPDPALKEELDKKKNSFGYEEIPLQHPKKPLKMNDWFILTAHLDGKEMASDSLQLIYESMEPNFYKLFIENPDKDLVLLLKRKNELPVWTEKILKEEYQSTGPVKAAGPSAGAAEAAGPSAGAAEASKSSTGPCDDATVRVEERRRQSPRPGPSGKEHRSAQIQEAKDKMRLLKILKKMDDDQFKEFKWHLENLSDIPASELEDKKKFDVVNKIWQTYTERSVEVTKIVLQEIPRTDLVQMLSEPSS
ncbi:NACHT, LRR and PYD domains-containing protein 1 homolog [Centropristis striata]|uniref:NACHT, LRR and PYD domains-containing protein 1 homolog n=1 Tax=Centropristis striata TaxID=184440 RepID=UPI0027DEC958|nr:NACHT, LRR and PYD domains-containing protein 1 homolog [Centropristis striata]